MYDSPFRTQFRPKETLRPAGVGLWGHDDLSAYTRGMASLAGYQVMIGPTVEASIS